MGTTGMRLAILCLLCGLPAANIFGQRPGRAEGSFQGQYGDLAPEQKRLVDDWCQRFSRTIKKTVNPAEACENLALSERTTFNAVNPRPVEEIDASKYPAWKKTYGSYYTTGFSLRRGTEDAPVLWSVWSREGGQWRIVSYVILTS